MLPDRYNRKKFSEAVNNPHLFLDEIRRVVRYTPKVPHATVGKLLFQKGHEDPITVIDQDWDQLFIMDACRYDKLREFNGREHIDTVISKGSRTKDFYKKNFSEREVHDTVIVTAVGWPVRLDQKAPDGIFHDVIYVRDELPDEVLQNKNALDDLTSPKNTHLHSNWEGFAPQRVAATSLWAYNKYPNKRIITHFMQPHDPYIGQNAESLREELQASGQLRSIEEERYPLLDAARDGKIAPDELKEIYMENLAIVSEYVEVLSETMAGKSVITADHGELLGDKSGLWKYAHPNHIGSERVPYGHPPGVFVEELRRVPWVIKESGERPKITAEPPRTRTEEDKNEIDERLRTLGYRV